MVVREKSSNSSRLHTLCDDEEKKRRATPN
jgi:hypothetical protein